MASADLKLAPDTARGYQLLEINDGNLSGLANDMIRRKILPDYRRTLFSEFKTRSSLLFKKEYLELSDHLIWLPRTNAQHKSLMRYEMRQGDLMKDKITIVNNDVRFLAATSNKALQYLASLQKKETADLFPRTQLVSMDLDTFNSTQRDYSGADDIVFKPLNECGGTGVRVYSSAAADQQIERTIHSWNMRTSQFSYAKQDWDAPIALIQDRVAPNLVKKEDAFYDSTMRAVFTVFQKALGEPWTCHMHGAYWKPAPEPYSGLGTTKEVVSFSRSVRNESWAVRGNGDMRVDKKYPYIDQDEFHVLPVEAETLSWLFPKLRQDMPVLIDSIVSTKLIDRVQDLMSSNQHCYGDLAAMLSLEDHDYYPEDIRDKESEMSLGLGEDTISAMERLVHRFDTNHKTRRYIQDGLGRNHRMKMVRHYLHGTDEQREQSGIVIHFNHP